MSYADQFLGQTMRNGTNGCVEAVGLMGAGNSPFLANEYNNGQFSVEGLVSDARNAGIPIIPYAKGAASPNDVYIYGNNDHATLADGSGGYWGNSSSQNQIVRGSDAESMGNLQPTAIIKTGGGQNGGFNFQAKDSQGNPFLNLKAYLRVSNPNERFDQQSIQSILGQSTPSYENQRLNDFLTHEDYSLDALSHGVDVYQYLKPHSDKLMALRDADLKARVDAETKQQRLNQAIQLANLINQSGSVDNRRAYSALGKMFGIGVPDDSDQFISSSDLLGKQIALNNAERNYNFEVEKQKKADEWNLTSRRIWLINSSSYHNKNLPPHYQEVVGVPEALGALVVPKEQRLVMRKLLLSFTIIGKRTIREKITQSHQRLTGKLYRYSTLPLDSPMTQMITMQI